MANGKGDISIGLHLGVINAMAFDKYARIFTILTRLWESNKLFGFTMDTSTSNNTQTRINYFLILL